ncbi:amino acid ABC transporter permease [Lachnoclostridium sp. An138]|uniref:amino acid ABC transporter permease n=1 Tax=Lachnoclostridium sp. An138 TaxID=1965560 RepID=UPI001FA8900E|nr:amino acid ABC transporter permease [Lachnoclostridium sp. An138]
MEGFIEDLKLGIYQTFILDNNYQYFVRGIGVTLLVTAFALLIGLALGVLVGIIRSAHDQQPEKKKGIVLRVLNGICKVYLTVIRGTPTLVQLLIMWFVIWASARSTDENMIRCAILSFGINSGAYVAEIIRSGIMSIDRGQMEAGRSLGLNYTATMRHVIIPQAFKNVLPALGNELITLLKETSVVTVIGLKDLTKGAMLIQSKTYQAFVPYIAIAVIYLALVLVLSWILGKVERRLRQSDLR